MRRNIHESINKGGGMKYFLFLFTIIVLIGCVTAEKSFRQKGLKRASFELDCPASKIKYNVLHRNDGLGCEGSQIGVAGCGKKAIYVCFNQEWINNTGRTKL